MLDRLLYIAASSSDGETSITTTTPIDTPDGKCRCRMILIVASWQYTLSSYHDASIIKPSYTLIVDCFVFQVLLTHNAWLVFLP